MNKLGVGALTSRLLTPCLMVTAIVGCAGGNAEQSETAIRLKRLATMYLDYAVSKGGEGPATEQMLKQHIAKLDRIQLEANGISSANVENIFKSARDSEPFIVRFGTSLTEVSGKQAPLLAYERKGAAGRRLVVYGNTKVAEIADKEFQTMLAEAKK